MKTTTILKFAMLTAFSISLNWAYGQTNQTNQTPKNLIRVKMVKNINGVETMIDTTLTMEGLEGLNLPDMQNINIDVQMDEAMKEMDSAMKEVKIVMKEMEVEMGDLEKNMHNIHLELRELDSIPELMVLENMDWKALKNHSDMEFDFYIDSVLDKMDKHLVFKNIHIRQGMNEADSNMTIMVLDENDAEFQKIIAEMDAEDSKGVKRERSIIIINEEGDENKNNPHQTQMKVEIVVKTCNIVELDKTDKKSLNPEVRSGFNENLKIDQVDFYPNPNNGRFNLSFNLSNQGDTEISIFTLDGKKVYEEKLPNFTGNYKQEIDISKNANGIYFIRVNQGKNAWFKKMILE